MAPMLRGLALILGCVAASDTCSSESCAEENTLLQGVMHARGANILQTGNPAMRNGDLEEGFSTGNYEYTHSIAGWTASGGTVSVRNGNGPWGGIAAASGNYLVALQSRGASIKQNIGGHVAGHSYVLMVSAAQRENSPGGQNALLKVSANGVELVNRRIASVGTMERLTLQYTADRDVVEIKLENTVASGDQTVFVDDIELVALPAPSPGPPGPVGPQGPTGARGATGANGATGSTGAPGATGARGEQGVQGAAGNTGARGATGSQGEQGEHGATGDRGEQGATGAQGEQGGQGPAGSTGARGEQGAQGEHGAPGATGAQGERGHQGTQGSQGQQGEAGARGSQGAQGAQGEQGRHGDTGAPGIAGPQGERGEHGAQGEQGVQGDRGASGERGAQGERGTQGDPGPEGGLGEKGDKGDRGSDGLGGPEGAQGPAGADGRPGADGSPGLPGADGRNGNDGSAGAAGPAGPAGSDGADGIAGPTGPAGADGADGVPAPPPDPALEERLHVVEEELNDAHSAIEALESQVEALNDGHHNVMVDGCENQNTEVERDVAHPDSGATASVRCCSLSGDSCDSDHLPGGCQSEKTFEEASAICAENGERLCTEAEIESRICCGTGCNFDGHQVWVSDLAAASWSQSGADNQKCQGDNFWIDNYDDCMKAAEDAGAIWASFRHDNPSDDGQYKCRFTLDAECEINSGTSNLWRVYHFSA